MTTASARRSLLPLLGVTALLLTSCGTGGQLEDGAGASASGTDGQSTGAAQSAQGEPVAVATTTQLGSVLDEIVQCNDASAVTVMGPGDDPHDFSASSQQVAQMATTGLVFINGLGLEAGMESALRNAEADGAEIVEIAPDVDPLPFAAHDSGHEGHDHGAHADEGQAEDGHDAHDHGSLDPHIWMDVARMADAAQLMGDQLAEHTGDDAFAECGDQVSASLEETDGKVREILSAIPEDRRTLVTDHAAYNYFADAYDFTVSGVVIPGGSTTGDVSSQQLAGLAGQIEEEGADAIVTSVGPVNAMVEALAGEVDGGIETIQLYEGGVGPKDSDAATYADAMVVNAQRLADALGK